MIVPSLFAPDIKKALNFYVGVLGFEQTGCYPSKEAAIWAEAVFNGAINPVRIWFFSNAIDDRPEPSMSGVIYIYVKDVDALAVELKDKISFRWGPEDMDYGLREIGVEDPNGYLLAFAQEI